MFTSFYTCFTLATITLCCVYFLQDINQNESIAIDPETDDPLDYYYLNHTLTINQPETLEVVREWRDILDQYSDRSAVENNSTSIYICKFDRMNK